MPLRFSFFHILIAIAFASIAPAVAQENPVSSFSFKQRIAFNPYPDSKQKITNDLLQYIAEGSDRLRTSVAYTLEGRVTARWDKGENGKQNLRLALEDLRLSGDIFYRDFSLEKVLIPDLVNLSLLIGKSGGGVILKKAFSDLPVDGNQVFLQQEIPGENNLAALIPSLENIEFGYSESTYHRVNVWFGYLEAYYEAGAQLEQWESDVLKMDFSDPANLIMNEFSLCEVEKKLAALAGKKFFKHLTPQAGDPEGFFQTYSRLSDRTYFLRSEFNHRMAIADRLLFDAGQAFLDSGQSNDARERFESSLVLNPFFVPSHLALAKLDLQEGLKSKAIERMGEVFSVIYPRGEWRVASEALTDSIFAQFFREAFNLNREGRFKENLDLLAPLENFCKRVEGDFECPYELEFRLNQTHMGMYRSFLVVGNRALRNDNLTLSRTYVSSALEYQRNNQRFIPDAGEALDVLQKCVYRYIEIAGERFAKGEYQRSGESLEAALELCSQYPALFCPADLGQKQQMAHEMQETRDQASRVNVNRTPQQPSLPVRGSLVQPVEDLLEQITQVQFLAWAGKIEEAKTLEEKLMMTLGQSSLDSDEKIASEMEKLNAMISSKECELARREVQSLLRKGLRFLEFSEHRQAYATAEKAREIMRKVTQCNLTANDTLDRLAALEPVINYLDLLETATSIYTDAAPQKYPEFLQKYHEAEVLFRTHQLEKKGITHLGLFSFISSSGNQELAKAGVLFMAEQPATYSRETVSLLLLLKGQGLSANDARSLQELAGKKLALWYHSDGTGIQPEILVHSLTRRDVWFRFFEQAFIRNWAGH